VPPSAASTITEPADAATLSTRGALRALRGMSMTRSRDGDSAKLAAVRRARHARRRTAAGWR
jgi:hypothetical protein